jgi:photosystem II stability/assembly factor-like uncharacterized protein
MKRILACLFLFSLLLTACNIPSAPVEETPAPYSPDTPSPSVLDAPIVELPELVSIQFVNSLDGWGMTDTRVVRTNDGGITWYDLTPSGVTETGYGAYTFALDASHFWMQLPDYENYPNGGTLYRTTDGGFTWSSAVTSFSGGDFQFLDPNNGWTLADLGVATGSNAVAIYQTADGGNSWTQKYINDPNAANAGDSLPLGGLKAGLAPLNMQTAWVYGVTYAPGVPYLFRTDDGGASWDEVLLPLPPGVENTELGINQDQMKFVSPDDGFIAMRLTSETYQLAVYVTNDAGNTWTLTPTLIPEGGSADFLSAEEAVIYNGRQFYVTRDAAQTWTIVAPDVKFDDIFAGMDFSNPSTGWVITLDPANQRFLYRSGDGGRTWFPIAP